MSEPIRAPEKFDPCVIMVERAGRTEPVNVDRSGIVRRMIPGARIHDQQLVHLVQQKAREFTERRRQARAELEKNHQAEQPNA